MTFTDDGSFVNTGTNKEVGDAVTGAYTSFQQPSSNQTYCTIVSNEVVETDGSTSSLKLDDCASQPCTSFDLKDTINPETINFKIKTTFLGSLTHVSP